MRTRSGEKQGVTEKKLTKVAKVSCKVRKDRSVSAVAQEEQATSPILVRKTFASRIKPQFSLLPEKNAKHLKENPPCAPASPITARKVLTLSGGRLAGTLNLHQPMSLDSAALDKENKNAVRGKFNGQRQVLAPLSERNTIVTKEKEMESVKKACVEKVNHKSVVTSDKDSFSVQTIQLPVRRSTRNKNNVMPVVPGTLPDKKSKGDTTAKKNASKKSTVTKSKLSHKKKNVAQQNLQVLSSTEPSAVVQVKAKNLRSTNKTDEKKVSGLKETSTVTPMFHDHNVNETFDNLNNKRSRAATVKKTTLNKNEKTRQKRTLLNRGTKGEGQTSSPELGEIFTLPKNDFVSQSVKPNVGQMLNKSLNVSSSPAVGHNERKLPVWASLKSTQTPGKRKSLRIGKDAYEFSFSPSKERIHKRVVRTKNQIKQKRAKPRSKLTILTTDPNFEKNFPSIWYSSDSTTRRVNNRADCSIISSISGDDSESTRDTAPSITEEEEFSIESVTSDNDNTDGIDIQESEEIFEEFEGETASSFVRPQAQHPTASVPMTSASALPTPALSKHIHKYIGGSSTPRSENTMLSSQELVATKAPVSVEADIALCFGFESEPETQEEEILNLSPVKFIGFQQAWEVTGTSDIADYDYYPATHLSRFTLQQSNQSNAFVSRSMNMSARGRSVSSLADASSKAQLQKSDLQKSSVQKRTRRGAVGKENFGNRRAIGMTRAQQVRVIQAENSGSSEISYEEAETSVLFDDEEEQENQQNVTKNQQSLSTNSFSATPTDQVTRTHALPSPEKSFTKAPKRSYNRSTLEESRKKFIKTYCGHDATTETESDQEVEEPKRKPLKRKRQTKTKDPPKKGKKTAAKRSESSEFSDSITKKSKSSKKTHKDNKSYSDWASHVNSHFSEVEDTFLVVE